MPSHAAEPLRALGAFLTGTEADGIATRLTAGATLSQALVVVPAARRMRARELLEAAGLGPRTRDHSVAVLVAVAGAASRIRNAEPVWTAPPGLLGMGTLTGDVFGMVGSAMASVVCATYNLQPTSALWKALVALVRERPGVSVRLYVDTRAADGWFAQPSRPARRPTGVASSRDVRRGSVLTTGDMARLLTSAVVMRTRVSEEDGYAVTSHAKFLSIDHRFLLVGSANFSYSAEERNVELGLRLDDPALAASVEKQMRDLEPCMYERVGI